MTLKNTTRKTEIFSDLKIAHSFVDNLFGLLQQSNQAMLFYTRFGIHTFGMRNKLDILILDSKWNVVKIKEGLKPNNIFFWNPIFNIVIEVPVGTIEKSKTEVGDALILIKKIAS